MGILRCPSAWVLAGILATALGCIGEAEWIRDPGDGGVAVTDGIVVEPWGEIDGEAVQRYTLDNGSMRVRIIDYGATVTECLVPSKNGDELVDVVLGFDDLEGYMERSPYFGCIVGRCANRIANGKFELGGSTYTLATNNGPHHLHGGDKGFDKRIWESRPISSEKGIGVEMRLISLPGDEGYPGEVRAAVRYILTPDQQLRVEMAAEAGVSTPVNLAHHSYWNLAGHGSGSCLDQELQLQCSKYTPAQDLIPTGEIAAVSGTPMDFTKSRAIGSQLDQLPKPGEPFYAGGYDHNYVIDGEWGVLRLAAKASSAKTGIVMNVYADQPGLQFYSGNFLDNVSGKGGATYPQYGGFCLESQIWPDAINRRDLKDWPNVVLNPGELYTHTMVHEFSVVD
ncbi:MAG: hypothetical protein CBC13_04340 [Planctomycetia bacterium TMED53]|nr:MAG: hypothetical protein CBC13_04340 [Planctomycetia bacterium TMED53]